MGKSSFLSLFLLTLAFSAKITRIDVSEQEPRRAVEGIFSPSPQPEDPGRALDPGLKEDPDITVELVNGVFHQASWDGASVAITADYPGLLPVSRVSRAKKPYPPKRTPTRYYNLPLRHRSICRNDGQREGPSP